MFGSRLTLLAVLVLLPLRSPAQPLAPGQPEEPPPGDGIAPAPAEADVPAGKEVFVQAAEAVQRAQAIRYHIRYHSTGGGLIGNMPEINASVEQLRTVGGVQAGWLIRAMGSSKAPGDEPAQEFDIAWMKDSVEFVDHKTKKLVEARLTDARKNKAFSIANQARLEVLYSMTPYSHELSSEEFTVEPDAVVDNTPCDVVVVKPAKSTVRTRWSISKQDHMPRRIERLMSGGPIEGSLITEVSGVQVETSKNSGVAEESLRVPLPDGYTEQRLPRPTVAPTPKPTTPAVEPGEPKPSSPPKPVPPPVSVTPNAPPFELSDPSGNKISLESLRGEVVVIEFAGTWTIPIRDSHPEFDSLAKKYAGKPVRCLWLDVRERDDANAADELHKANYAFTLLLHADKVAAAYEVKTYPSFAVVGPAGELLKAPATYMKSDTFHAIEQIVDAQLAKLPHDAKTDTRPDEPPATPGPTPAPPK